MPFEKGKAPGRPKGAQNRATITVKDAFAAAFSKLQDDPAVCLVEWGKENPTEFYKLASKLIPMQVSGDPENPLEMKHDLSGLDTDELAALANAIIKLNVEG
jgi:hypothetical protein